MIPENLYHYRAFVEQVYDGDTCTVRIDLGLSIFAHGQKIRLARINAPEIRGAERETGLVSRDFLRARILGKEVFVQTIKDKKGKYGRYLAEIWLPDESGMLLNINDLLVENDMAIYQVY
jgi:micrococcal nuclease